MSIEEDESVNNKEISLLKKIIDENDVLKGRTIYTDDVGIGLPQCIFWFKELPFDMSIEKQASIEKKLDGYIELYRSRNGEYVNRLRREYEANREKYLEQFGKQYDDFVKMKYTTELPDRDDVLIILKNANKKLTFSKSVCFMRESLKDEPIQEHKILATRGSYVWTSNYPVKCESVVIPINPEDSEGLPYPMLDLNYYPSKNDRISFCVLTGEQASRFRKLKTHKFVSKNKQSGIGVLINGQLAGAFGYNQSFSTFMGAYKPNELFLQYAIACTPFNRKVRLGKLIDMISLWDVTAKYLLNDYEKERYDRIVSTSITPYPECKHARRLMELQRRTYDEKSGMYKLVYGCEMTHWKNIKQIFDEWMRKEKL